MNRKQGFLFVLGSALATPVGYLIGWALGGLIKKALAG